MDDIRPGRPSRRRQKLGARITGLGIAGTVLGTLAFALFPIYYMVSTSLRTPSEIIERPFGLPLGPTLENYGMVLEGGQFLGYTVNSTVIALGTTVISLIIGLPAAYAIARYQRYRMGILIMLARIAPGVLFLVPWFVIFSRVDMIDSYTALILSHTLRVLPMVAWLMVGFFQEVPNELEEAAYVDGASPLRAFLQVILPLTRGGVAAVSILGFVFSWNNFLFASVLTRTRTQTLPVAVFQFMTYGQIEWGGITAAATLMTVPVLVLVLLVQRNIVRGLVRGAVTG